MDACRSDPEKGRADVPNKLKADFSRDLVKVARSGTAGAKGTAVLFACSENQRSYEWQPFGHGAFTYFLLEALSAKAATNGVLTMHGVAQYVDDKIQDWGIQNNKQQAPTLKTDGTTEIVLAQFSKPKPKFKTNSKDGAKMIFIPAGEFTMGSPQSEIDALVTKYASLADRWEIRRAAA